MQFGRSKSRWSKGALQEITSKNLECIQLAQDRMQWWTVVNTEMNIRVTPGERNVSTSTTTVSLINDDSVILI
jgi:hypothetical protein